MRRPRGVIVAGLQRIDMLAARIGAFAQAAPLKSFPPTLHRLSPTCEPVHRIGRDTDLFSNKTESAFSMYAYTPRSNQFLSSPPQKGTPMQRLHDRAQSARGTVLAAIIVGGALATAAHAQTIWTSTTSPFAPRTSCSRYWHRCIETSLPGNSFGLPVHPSVCAANRTAEEIKRASSRRPLQCSMTNPSIGAAFQPFLL